jgi:hypothetical protein
MQARQMGAQIVANRRFPTLPLKHSAVWVDEVTHALSTQGAPQCVPELERQMLGSLWLPGSRLRQEPVTFGS